VRSQVLAIAVLAAGCASRPPADVGVVGAGTVILVRHAEKASETEPDASLSAAGRARAEALADALRHAGVTRVIVSHRRRTGETAEPLTRALGIVPDTVPVGSSVPDHLKEVARRVRLGRRGATLVVGHSNTIPGVVSELTGVPLADLCDAEYATMFVVTLPASGPGRFIRTRFGAPDSSATACAAMAPG